MKLYVGNLPWSIDDRALKDLFSSYGDITEAVLIKDKFSGRSKGFGFVTFSNEADAQKAIAEMHEKDIEGRPLTVSEARPMVSRDRGSNGNGSEDEQSEAPVANHSQINNQIEDDDAPEVLDDNSDAESEEEEINSVDEAKDDASYDEPDFEEEVEEEDKFE